MVYLCGVSIGLLLLGAFNVRRTREAQRRQAQEAAQHAAQAEADQAALQAEAPAANPS
jgi:hypothetical protein